MTALKKTKQSKMELTAGFLKKRSKTHERLNRTLLNQTKQVSLFLESTLFVALKKRIASKICTLCLVLSN